MKKRLFCLLLCLLMIMPMVFMAGCSETTEETPETTASASGVKAMTLTLYSITDEKTTEEAIQQVQDAINAITEVKFNTHIILRLFTEADYMNALDEKIMAIEKQIALDESKAAAQKVAAKAAKAAGVTTAAETTGEGDLTEETDETVLNEYGLEKTVYPEEDGDQLDIFLVKGLDAYQEYVSSGVLAPLDEELSVNSKILHDYIYPTFLSAAKIEGVTYAIPNNHMVGEYEYILINKELFDKYYFDPDKVADIDDLQEFVETVGTQEKSYVPVLNTSDTYIYYPTGSRSVFAGYAAGASSAIVKAAPGNLFANKQFKTTASLMIDWTNAGYINTTGTVEDTKFGVAFVKGDYSLLEKYEEDYYVTLYKNATFENKDVYDSMYAVGAYTKNVSRCMEVIKYLTINDDLRNTFQYGAKNIHYEIDDITGTVNIISDEYVMDPVNTGNQFKLWINNAMTESELALAANNWELAKLHNFNSAVSPYLGFTIKPEPEPDPDEEPKVVTNEEGEVIEFMALEDILAGLEDLSDEYFDKLYSFKGEYNDQIETVTTDADGVETVTVEDVVVDIAAHIDILAEEIKNNEYMIAALDAANEFAPLSQYTAWYNVLFPPAE
ncbi:MAG: hypothetical protein ACYCWE_07430 [Eubacteriales bacterium]